MSVLDLKRRITNDKSAYQHAIRSDDSLVYIEPVPQEIESASIDLTVGQFIFDSKSGDKLALPEQGFTLRAGRSVVVYTSELVYLPLNVFGLLSGKGSLIYYGVFISQGKVDPGFQDHLKVGLFNGSKSPLQLTAGMPICSCSLFQMETHVQEVQARQSSEPVKPLRPTVRQRLSPFWTAHWKFTITTVIALVVLFSKLAGYW